MKSHHISFSFSGTDNIKTFSQSDLMNDYHWVPLYGTIMSLHIHQIPATSTKASNVEYILTMGRVWDGMSHMITSSCSSLPEADSIHEHLLVNVAVPGILIVASLERTRCSSTISVSYSLLHAIVPIAIRMLLTDILKSKVQNLTLDCEKQACGDLFFGVHS